MKQILTRVLGTIDSEEALETLKTLLITFIKSMERYAYSVSDLQELLQTIYFSQIALTRKQAAERLVEVTPGPSISMLSLVR